MTDFTSSHEVQAWLSSQPLEIVYVFSARAALRLVPNLVFVIGRSSLESWPEEVILPSFWAIGATLAAGKWSNRVVDLASAESKVKYAFTSAVGNEAVNAALNIVEAASKGSIPDASVFELDDSHFQKYAELSLDRIFVDNGGTAHDLADQKLIGTFDFTQDAYYQITWKKLKAYLLSLNGQKWQVWTDWYEDRLNGEALIEEIEIGLEFETNYGRVTFPYADYSHPSKINYKIKSVINNYWANQKPPPQKVASVRTVIRDGKIYLNTDAIDSDLELHLAQQNLGSLKEELIDFCSLVSEKDNYDYRPVNFIKTIISLISDELPDSRTLFRLIRKEAVLLKHEDAVQEQWPQFLADHYSAICTELGQVLDQFPDRRVFQRQKLKAEIEKVEFSEFEEKFENVTDVMREQSVLIDSSVSDEIEAISNKEHEEEIDIGERTIIIADKLESTNNVLKLLCDTSLDKVAREEALNNIANSYGEGVMAGVLIGSSEAGMEDGKKLGRALGRSEATKAMGEKLHEKYPKTFGWMKRFLKPS